MRGSYIFERTEDIAASASLDSLKAVRYSLTSVLGRETWFNHFCEVDVSPPYNYEDVNIRQDQYHPTNPVFQLYRYRLPTSDFEWQ